jgi:hypothetical protein
LPDRNRNLRGAVNDEKMHRGKANRPPVHLSVVKSAEVGAWRGEAVEAVEATEAVTDETSLRRPAARLTPRSRS